MAGLVPAMLLSGGKNDVDARVKRGQDEDTGHEAFGDQLPSHDDRDQQTSGTVPAVFVLVSDPVAQGFAESLTKSSGNPMSRSGCGRVPTKSSARRHVGCRG
jgi:hypothetical protein